MPPQQLPNVNFQDYLNRITQARQEYGQRVAEAPRVAEDLRKMIYGGDELLPQMRGQRTGKVQELWEHDKRLAERYANPESEVYLEDPYAREQARAGQAQATVGEIGDLESMIAGREDILGDMLERGLRVFEAGTRAKQVELQGLMDEMNMAMKLQDRLDKQREKATKTAATPADLGQLYDRITQVRGGFEERANMQEGTLPPPPQGMSVMDYLAQSDIPVSGREEVTYTKLPDGSIEWAVRPGEPQGGFQYQQPPEGDIRDIINRLGGATVTAFPESRTDITALTEMLQLPETDRYPETEATMRAGIADDIRTPEKDQLLGEMLRAERDPNNFEPYSMFEQDASTPSPSASLEQQAASEAPSVPAQSAEYPETVKQEVEKALQGQQGVQDAINNIRQQFPTMPYDQIVSDVNTIWVRGG